MIKEELEIKETRIRNLLEKKNLSGILLSKQTNFLWFTGGRRNDVIKNDDVSLVYLFITRDSKYLIATKSDANRVMDEELKGLGFELVLYNWYDQSVLDALKRIGDIDRIGCDYYCRDFLYVEEELVDLRINLTDFEVERVKKLCREYTELLTDFCLNLKPNLTEREVAADLSLYCLKCNISPLILMVGSDERIFEYRHPVATNKRIKKYVLIATVVERGGLNVSISRSIYFGKVPQELRDKQKAVNFIESNYYYYSVPGIRLKELFGIGKKLYLEMGYPDEWRNHTQGGIAGYKSREYLVSSNSEIVLNNNNVMGWNPTIRGVKAEDFILVQRDGAEQLSIDGRWPCTEINIKDRKFFKPEILEIR